MIYFISDLHLFHNRLFLYKPRGFDCVEDMNAELMKNILDTVTPDDDLYILGDIMLGQHTEEGMEMLRSIPCKLHIIRGNHDTDRRVELYKTLPNLVGDILWADRLDYKKYHIMLTHWPMITGSLENKHLKEMTMNFYGHTHQMTNFYEDRPFMYHVGADSHHCGLVSIDDALAECEAKVKEGMEFL